MNANNFFTQLLQDIKTDLADEFDRNFERKAFFNEPWPQTTHPNNNGSLMLRTGDLRKSIAADFGGGSSFPSLGGVRGGLHQRGNG
jgi:hypothetical protein